LGPLEVIVEGEVVGGEFYCGGMAAEHCGGCEVAVVVETRAIIPEVSFKKLVATTFNRCPSTTRTYIPSFGRTRATAVGFELLGAVSIGSEGWLALDSKAMRGMEFCCCGGVGWLVGWLVGLRS
jgi:hypothetical protein